MLSEEYQSRFLAFLVMPGLSYRASRYEGHCGNSCKPTLPMPAGAGSAGG